MKSRADSNQNEIVKGLEKVGAKVKRLTMVGYGAPDIVAGFRGRNYLMEIKSKHGKLSNDQRMWHATWNGQVAVVRDLDEAIKVIYEAL